MQCSAGGIVRRGPRSIGRMAYGNGKELYVLFMLIEFAQVQLQFNIYIYIVKDHKVVALDLLIVFQEVVGDRVMQSGCNHISHLQ